MRYSKKTMKLRMDYNNMMSASVGKDGFTDKNLSAIGDELTKAFNAVEAGKGKGMMGGLTFLTTRTKS